MSGLVSIVVLSTNWFDYQAFEQRVFIGGLDGLGQLCCPESLGFKIRNFCWGLLLYCVDMNFETHCLSFAAPQIYVDMNFETHCLSFAAPQI